MRNIELISAVTWALATFCKQELERPLNELHDIVWNAIEFEGFTREQVEEETDYQVRILRDFNCH